MINKSIVDGFTSLDGCYKLSDSDCTIDCYVIPRSILERKQEIDDWELKTNSVYLLIGKQNDKIMAYAGKGEIGKDKESAMRRLQQHLTKNAELTEKYFSFWTQALVFVCKNTDPGLQWDTSITGDLEAILIGDIKYEYNWKGKSESIRNPLSPDRIRGHAVKLACIKGYVKELGFTFLDEDNTAVSSKNLSKNSSGSTIVTEEEIAKQEKQIIDKTVALETKNLEIDARIPEYTTPEKVVNQMLDLLPWDTFNHETKFLDLACKGGEFLALIHDRLSEVLQRDEYFSKYTGKEKDVRIHDYIVNNQLYGVAIGDNSYAITMDRVYDCPHIVKAKTGAQGYINYIKCLSGTDSKKQYEKQQILKAQQSYINEILGVQNMTFDVVIGNPPYQETTGGGNNGGKVIYDSFILNGLNISDKLCMIVKNNWMNSDSLKGLREEVIKSGLKTLTNYSLLGDIFPNMGIAASIIYIDKNYNGAIDYKEIVKDKIVNEYVEDIKNNGFIPASKYECSIVSKVKAITKESFAHHVVGMSPFGINTNGAISNGFIDESVKKTDYYNIGLKYVDNFTYTNLDCFTKNIELVDKYKIICPKQIHKTNNPIPSVLGLRPNNICSASYSLMYCDADAKRASNVAKYIKTRFFRFLTYCLADSLCGLNAYRVSLVPDQDFTSASNIDWSQPISNIDRQLYKKYNLSEDEVAYIESTIKSLDTTVEASPTMKFTLQEAEANLINRRIQNEEF